MPFNFSKIKQTPTVIKAGLRELLALLNVKFKSNFSIKKCTNVIELKEKCIYIYI